MKSAYGRDKVTKENVEVFNPLIRVLTILFQTPLTTLNAYTSANTTKTLTYEDITTRELYNIFNEYLEIIDQTEIEVPMIVTPYFGADEIDTTAFNEYHNGMFTVKDGLKIAKIGNQITLSMPWARKTGFTFTADNGFYTKISIFLVNN